MNKALEITAHQTPNLRVVSAAKKFHFAALQLREDKDLREVCLVNAALSLELYLKSLNATLHFMEGVKEPSGIISYAKVGIFASTKSHEPGKLFGALSPEIQSELTKQFSNHFPSTTLSLQATLDQYRNLFVEWRYIFEGNGNLVNVTELFELLSYFSKIIPKFSFGGVSDA